MAENKLTKALPWFIGGVVVGAAVGVLYAPKKGEETRRDVAEWLRQKREETRELANRLKNRIPAKKEQVAAAFRAGKEAFQQEAGNHRAKEPIAA